MARWGVFAALCAGCWTSGEEPSDTEARCEGADAGCEVLVDAGERFVWVEAQADAWFDCALYDPAGELIQRRGNSPWSEETSCGLVGWLDAPGVYTIAFYWNEPCEGCAEIGPTISFLDAIDDESGELPEVEVLADGVWRPTPVRYETGGDLDSARLVLGEGVAQFRLLNVGSVGYDGAPLLSEVRIHRESDGLQLLGDADEGALDSANLIFYAPEQRAYTLQSASLQETGGWDVIWVKGLDATSYPMEEEPNDLTPQALELEYLWGWHVDAAWAIGELSDAGDVDAYLFDVPADYIFSGVQIQSASHGSLLQAKATILDRDGVELKTFEGNPSWEANFNYEPWYGDTGDEMTIIIEALPDAAPEGEAATYVLRVDRTDAVD